MRDLHVEFIEAGARVITINSYAATPERLAREGAEEMFEPLQQRALDLAHAARDAARGDGEVRIAGCLSPLFGSYHPELTISFEETLGIYRRIVAQQADRVDLMLCETMASAEEARAAAIAASESGKPVWVSWTLADDGPPRLRSGETLATAAAALEGIALDARLVNCSRPEAVDAATARPARARRAGRRLRQRVSRGGQAQARRHRRRARAPRGSRCPSATPTSRSAGPRARPSSAVLRDRPEHIAALRDRLHAAGIVTSAA